MTVRGLDGGQRAALVISECQNGITNRAFSESPLARQVTERGIIPKIAELAAAFRNAGLPVIHCLVSLPPEGAGWRVNCVLAARLLKERRLVSGTSAAAVHDDLPVEPTDIVSERHHGMAPFTGTMLNATLRRHDIETVVLAGVSTNVALPGAATEAVGLGYNVVLAEDCAAGGTAETHRMQIAMHLPLIATISGSAAIRAVIRSPANV